MRTLNNRVSVKMSGEYSWTTPASEALETSMPVGLETQTQGILTKNSRCPSPPDTTVVQNRLITSSEYKGDDDSDNDEFDQMEDIVDPFEEYRPC